MAGRKRVDHVKVLRLLDEGLPQSEVARRCKTTQSTVSKIARARPESFAPAPSPHRPSILTDAEASEIIQRDQLRRRIRERELALADSWDEESAQLLREVDEILSEIAGWRIGVSEGAEEDARERSAAKRREDEERGGTAVDVAVVKVTRDYWKARAEVRAMRKQSEELRIKAADLRRRIGRMPTYYSGKAEDEDKEDAQKLAPPPLAPGEVPDGEMQHVPVDAEGESVARSA